MSYTVLARRYRSATFDEVVGQNHVAQTLKKAIASGRVAHAYLFTGTRGVGKTSMARILAKALNCEKSDGATSEPCCECSSCQAIARGDDIDVIEIDAASNRGIDNIRELIANAQYRPARSRFKIYIIDEVHGLSKDAFNALLKLLEEPPSHVKFILATTEVEKVLPTILSRCQRFDFRNIPSREIAEHLRAICKDEKIQADEDALALVAKAGAGSMRDALSLLDRLLSIGEKKLTVATIEQLLGLPRSQLVFEMVQAMGEGRVKDVLASADRMINEGLSPDGLLASLVDHLRNLLIIRTCGADSTLVEAGASSLAELAKQAERFEAVVLSQDISVIEELRRQIRQVQAGRALLDATLVRLALAEQFSSISDLLARVEGAAPGAGGAGAVQKKKPEPLMSAAGAVAPAPVVSPVAAPTVVVAPVAQSAPMPVVAVAVAATPAAAGIAPVPVAAPDLDLDEDDDLPRPGKVWDGPSLSDALKSAVAAASAKAPEAAEVQGAADAAAEQPNVEAVAQGNFAGVWQALLKLAEEHGPGFHALVSAGQFVKIEDEQAVIRYADEQFPKMLGRNGKRDLLCEFLTRVVGRPMGVRFEVVEAPAQPAGNEVKSEAVAARPGPAKQPARAPAPEAPRPAPMPAAPPPKRLTPEQTKELERDPLISALMSGLGATIVKISEEQ